MHAFGSPKSQRREDRLISVTVSLPEKLFQAGSYGNGSASRVAASAAAASTLAGEAILSSANPSGYMGVHFEQGTHACADRP